MAFLRRSSPPPTDPASQVPLSPTFHDDPPRLALDFERLPPFDGARLGRAIRDVDQRLNDARAEIISEALDATTHGLTGWGADEVVHVDGSGGALPDLAAFDDNVRYAPLDPKLVAAARAGQGHIVLTYVGRTPAADIQMLALEVVAAALATLPGAQLVRNPEARNALSADRVRSASKKGLDGLRSLPRLSLACGIALIPVPGRMGLWARTFGAKRYGLPDLARLVGGPDDRMPVIALFTGVHDYIAASKATIRPGDHLDAGAAHLVARAPRREEHWLTSPGELLVLDDRPA
jgi:hypothetical protein